MAISYQRIGEVTESVDGLPTRLVLQLRSHPGHVPHHMVSWRTVYPSGMSNRRFYWQPNAGPWTIPVSVALRLMEEADSAGLLDSKYDRSYERYKGGRPTFDITTHIDRASRVQLLDEVTCDREEPDWGTNPLLVVATEPGGVWRKVMLVDSRRHTATFRSCTLERDYKPVRLMRSDSRWRLDNAMMDCGAECMREFLGCLREE